MTEWLTPTNVSLILNGIVILVGGFLAKGAFDKVKSIQTKEEIQTMIDTKVKPLELELDAVKRKSDKNALLLDTKFEELNKVLTTMSTDIAYIKGKSDGRESR